MNRLRGRIAVQVDGQLKTGRDVIVGALLGADEFGFSTAPLVAEGCIMMRKCHLNTCPVGIATQDPELRRKFTGQPEHVVNYFFFVAEEVRELMAKLGVRRFADLIGRADLLDMRRGIEHWKASGLDFSRIFFQPTMPDDVARRHCETQDHGLGGALDHRLISAAAPAIDKKEPARLAFKIRNANRSVGAMLSGVVRAEVRARGPSRQHDPRRVRRRGRTELRRRSSRTASRSSCKGATNDYVGKGLSGGRIVVYPDPAVPARPERTSSSATR
jgi:glutamate synthase (NADPH/NADH) large chain